MYEIGELGDFLIRLRLYHLHPFVPSSRWPLKCLNRIVCKQTCKWEKHYAVLIKWPKCLSASQFGAAAILPSLLKYSQPCRKCELLLSQSFKLERRKTPWTPLRPGRSHHTSQHFGRCSENLQREVLWTDRTNRVFLAGYKSSWKVSL